MFFNKINAQENVHRFFNAETTTKTGFELKTSKENEYLVTYILPYLETKEVNIGSDVYTKVLIPGAGYYNQTGYPQLPVIQTFIKAINNLPVKIEIIEIDTVSLYIGKIYPAQKPVKRNALESLKTNDLLTNSAFYTGTKSFPDNFYSNHGFKTISNKTVLDLWLNPVIYFPDEGRIRVAKKIILKIIFTPNPANKKNIGNTQPNNINDNYSSHFIKSPVNIGPNNPGAPHLLIVTADNYYNSIKPFADWKNRTGYVTNILKTSQINSNPSDSDIKSAIKDSFNNGSAQYVLLVGDWFDIPNFFGVTNLYSDHYYSTMNDTDFLPDLVLGRLPVIDIADCDLYVRKTIKYESRPDTGQGINWYKKATSAASNSNLDDWHGRNVVHFFKEHHFISVDDFRGSQNRFTGANIKSAIDSGRSWMFYIGHGDRKSWSVPDVFSNNNVQSLLNTNMLPAVVSIACANAKISNPDICFGQKWMNVADNRGACVFLGATDDTYFLYSDTLGKYAMFSYVNGETETFGDAMNYGKLLMYQCFPPDTNTFATQETIELFIILGDPTIMPWTDIPHPVTADYPHPILPGTNNISFTVKSGDTIVKHAMVSLTNKDFTFRRFAYSDSLGNVSFNGPFPNQGHIYIVISGHNLYPLFDSIRTDTATSIENYYSTNLQVELYPQPFSSNCRVKISGSLNKISSAEILNMQGSVCREIRDINSNEFIIEKGNLASGMYLLKLADGQNRYYYHKLIVN